MYILSASSVMFSSFKVLTLFLASLASLVHAEVVISDSNLVSGKSYDYIVVGGGLAGLTVGSIPFSQNDHPIDDTSLGGSTPCRESKYHSSRY